MVEVAQEIVGDAGGARAAPLSRRRSASAFYRHLVWLYLQGTGSAVAVVLFLAAVGLDFTLEQWVMLISMTIPAVAFYVIPDVYLITRHFRPIRMALERLDRGEKPDQGEASAGIFGGRHMPHF